LTPAAIAMSEPTSPKSRRHKLLIVEDDPRSRELLRTLLTVAGYKVIATSSVRDAVTMKTLTIAFRGI
jgi:CheY-like chemotaxis protein